MSISYRKFQKTDMPKLYQAFTLAFSSNAVPFKPTYPQFEIRIFSKLGISPDHSLLAFDASGDLVGFNLHTIGEHEGMHTAYNGGMGVIPSYRRKGVARKLFEGLELDFRRNNINRVLLEVVSTNQAALKLYGAIGFSVLRRLKCFKRMPSKVESAENLFEIRELTHLPADVPFDYSPTFMDATNQILRNQMHEHVFGGFLGDTFCGFVSWQPHLSRISQLFIYPDFRRQGLGSCLVHFIINQSVDAVTLMNVPEDESGMILFLEKMGFVNEIDQFEMELII